ncbi:hypothetical protein KAI54_03720 [Candidatus Gracilibacteria bacterium]|nr:hypothetical protein [Candidatus Gracilibacteria bacterium]
MTKYTSRLRQGANIRFGLTVIIAVLAAIFIIWPNYQKLIEVRAKILEVDKQTVDSELELESERDQYRILKAEYNLRAKTNQRIISTILPERAEETKIIRELEKKANELAGGNESLILEMVNFGKTSLVKDMDYLILPIKIRLLGTKEKLMAFLRYFEKTGNITVDDEATRLLDVKDVNMKIKDRGSKTEIMKEITIDITVNAYNLPSLEKIAASN